MSQAKCIVQFLLAHLVLYWKFVIQCDLDEVVNVALRNYSIAVLGFSGTEYLLVRRPTNAYHT